jgi:CII-binding regulator of phage lambda lysogenization HflD
MFHRLPIRPALVLLASFGALASGALGCERTAEGAKQDALAATAVANESAEQAKQGLQTQMDAFKAQTNAQLERLSVAVAKLEAKTSAGIDDSKQKLQTELDETKQKLGELSAESGAELEKAKADLGARINDLGKRINSSVDEAGEKVRDTLE